MKIELEDTLSGFSITKINANFQKIEDALNDDVLYRDNPVGEPNQMEQFLDMNGQRIINLPAPAGLNDAARLADIVNAVTGIVPAAAIPFSPTVDISATDVQAAIEELSDEVDRTLRTDLNNKVSAALGAGLVGFSAELIYPDKSIGKRIHRDYINISDIGGADPTGAVDNRSIVLAAKATGKLVRIDGTYRIDGDIPDSLVGFVGDGARKSRLIFNNSDGFTFSNAALNGRKVARFEDFAIDSLSNSCDAKFAFKASGVANGAAPVYNSGARITGVIVGDDGRFGGYAYLKDCFYFTIEDARGTDLSRGVQLVGSNVGHRITGFRANNDSAATTLSRYGISTESASYSAGVMVPENLKVDGFQFVRCARAINHTAGLFIHFAGIDTEADEYGAMLNAECTFKSSLVAPGTAAAAWTGVFIGSAIATPDAGVWVEDVDVNILRAPSTPGSSYGVDIGNGADPVYLAHLNKIRLRGISSSLLMGIRARGLRALHISGAAIRNTTVTSNAIDVNGRRVTLEDNVITDGSGNTAGTIVVTDGGNSTDSGRLVNNQSSTLTFTTPTNRGNWLILGNDGVKRWNRGATSIADGGTISHGLSATPSRIELTTSTSGEFASVTATSGSTFTVAIKKHDGTAGTTGTVYWEADY